MSRLSNQKNSVIKICIAEDHELFRIGLRHVLNEIPNTKLLCEASNGLELIKSLKSHLPDIIFMDINMPVLDGIETTKQIREKYPNIKIIVLTAAKDASYFEQLVSMGIKGFILKSASANEIRTAIAQINNGVTYISNDLFDLISELITQKDKINTLLSKREIEILELISQGLNNKDIATKLFISQRTVEKHKYNMMAKTNTKNTVQLLVFAIKNNIIKS